LTRFLLHVNTLDIPNAVVKDRHRSSQIVITEGRNLRGRKKDIYIYKAFSAEKNSVQTKGCKYKVTNRVPAF
jgi:hypothetical protein